jgi:hypothetical protein
VWLGAALLCGCGKADRTAELEARLAAATRENEALRKQLETDGKRVEQAIAANASLAPKIAQLESELDAARRALSRITAVTADGMNERMREEVKRIVQEVLDAHQEERLAEQREWMDDLRSRHMDELVAAAHLSPEQKEKLKLYEEEEREALRTAYMKARERGLPMDATGKVREQAREERENKIKALLDADQYAKYAEWKRQEADLYRFGINRRQQSPNANQKDM